MVCLAMFLAAMHHGVDLAAAHGEMVVAALVVLAGEEVFLGPLHVLGRQAGLIVMLLVLGHHRLHPSAHVGGHAGHVELVDRDLDCHRPGRTMLSSAPAVADLVGDLGDAGILRLDLGPLLHAASGSAQAINSAASISSGRLPVCGSRVAPPPRSTICPRNGDSNPHLAWPSPRPAEASFRTSPARPDKAEGGKPFKLVSDYEPAGDQPTAIKELTEAALDGEKSQVLLGVTGSGKTFTMAKVIETLQRPALVIAPNKILAAQLYGEFKSFFPDNAVEYFVSYYDYYQPEAYVAAHRHLHREGSSSVNEAIDRMRHSATRSLLERDDVIIVASVSCLYGIGSVETYSAMTFSLKKGAAEDQREVIRKLVALQYRRNDQAFARGNFRVRGDSLEIFPSHYEDTAWRVSLLRRRDRGHHRVRSADRQDGRQPRQHQGLCQLALCDARARRSSRRWRRSSTSLPSG